MSTLQMVNFMENEELHAIARGQVQGVGFRATVHQHAIRLGLKGTVCNLSDGSVEIYVQGPKKDLELLIQRINEEFGPKYLSSFSQEYSPIKKQFEHFSIVYGKSHAKQ